MSNRNGDIWIAAKGLLGLGLPLVGAAVAGFMIHMTDTVMLGWYSVTALAAATIGTSLWFVIFIVGAGFGHAVMPLVAEASAAGDEVRVRRVTRMALWLSGLFSCFAMVLLWNAEPILLAMGQVPEVASQARDYLRIAGFGILPALAANVLRAYLGALKLTAVQLWITLAGLVLNALVNYALIFGNWGAPELGIRGAAMASVLLQTLTFVALAVYAAKRLPQYTLFIRFWRPDPGAMNQVFRLGLPIGLTSLAESGLFTGSAIMMGWIGETELAAHGIALQLTALAFMFHVGMSQAATVQAGGALARKDEAELRRVAIAAHIISLSFGILIVALFLAVPGALVSLFLDPDEPRRAALIAIGSGLVQLAALFQFVDATQILALSLLRGLQDTTRPMWLATLSYWVIGMPVSYWLTFELGLGPPGLWLGLTVGLGMAAILLSWRFWRSSIKIGKKPV